ncbi:MAG: site-specific integrase, partial [Pseudomonadales bacterium]|nr:site-specific integrase [Pseudomonadales bacterium]
PKITAWRDIRLRVRIHEKILKQRGVQAFLFRDPGKDKASPMTASSAFSNALPMLLYTVQHKNEKLAEKLSTKNSGIGYKSAFTPHSMRTSLITAYIVDGKAPIAMISKLVGHSSIVMTIYYTQVGNATMRKTLDGCEEIAVKNSAIRHQDLIINKRISEVKSDLIASDKDFFDQINDDWPAAAYQFTDKWICAMSGAACDQGGELMRGKGAGAIYAPVHQGYLGKRNCIRCRFLITGPAFLGGLKSLANEIMLEIATVRDEYIELEEQITTFEDERYDAEQKDIPFTSSYHLQQAQSSYEEKALKLDMFFSDFQVLSSKITESINLLNNQKNDGKKQLIVHDGLEFNVAFSENETNFRLLASICTDAEIYTSASASRATPLLASMLDNFADNNGLQPAMYKLSDKQKLTVANQITQLMMSKIDNNWDMADQLMSGALLLEDLLSTDKLQPLGKSIESLMRGYENTKFLEKIND